MDSGSLRSQPSSASPSSCSAKPGQSGQGQSTFILLLDFRLEVLKCTYRMYQFQLNFTYPSLFCYCVKIKKMYVHPWESARIGKKEIPWSPQYSSAPFILLPNTYCRPNPGVVAAPDKLASRSHIRALAIGPVRDQYSCQSVVIAN